jgi:hypothetical protein
MTRVLVAGWFSFEHMGASAGDLLARDITCSWLARAGRQFDIAGAPPFPGIDWRTADASLYSDVVFVCGPVGNGPPITEFLQRFRKMRLIGLNLTMLHDPSNWNPFDLLWERDSSSSCRPDMVFGSSEPYVPVVGLVLIDAQPEYGANDRLEVANSSLRVLAERHQVAAVPIDTRLDINSTGLHTAAQVQSLIARMQVVLTTRLHGTVLALKAGVPVVAVDPVSGGGKVSRQARALGWPVAFDMETLNAEALDEALRYCLTEEARMQARECAARARAQVSEIGLEFSRVLTAPQV